MVDYDPNYYTDGYKYNNTFMQPRPPYYGQLPVPYGPKPPMCPMYHIHGKPEKLPPIKRPPHHPDSYYMNPPFIPSAKECNCSLPDRFPVNNIINVESRLLITLKITLYGVKEEDDVTVILENDKKYKFSYLTENGVEEITGILRYIDTNIPTDCIRYIGENNEVTNYAYLIVDGSTEGYSNIVKIFIRSLRGIEEIKEEEPEDKDTEDTTSETHDAGSTTTEDVNEKDVTI